MRSTQLQLGVEEHLNFCLKTQGKRKTCVEMAGRRIFRMREEQREDHNVPLKTERERERERRDIGRGGGK
jgi:hypothetical protein